MGTLAIFLGVIKATKISGNDFALMDNNVTITHLKNLVIDKPAPITVKLAQVSGNDFALMDNNVTIGNLKNLVIDKPAPITVKLAQISRTSLLISQHLSPSSFEKIQTLRDNDSMRSATISSESQA